MPLPLALLLTANTHACVLPFPPQSEQEIAAMAKEAGRQQRGEALASRRSVLNLGSPRVANLLRRCGEGCVLPVGLGRAGRAALDLTTSCIDWGEHALQLGTRTSCLNPALPAPALPGCPAAACCTCTSTAPRG